MNRRHFLSTSASALAVSAVSGEVPVQRSGVPIDQEPLSYEFGALEPYIDAATMETHYSKCHAAYVADLRVALDSVNLQAATVTSLLRTMNHLTPQGGREGLTLGQRLDKVPEDVKLAILHNGGGHMNHTLFWRYMAPPGNRPQKPQGSLAEALQCKFGGIDEFKKAFAAAAMKHFGSGWVWLAYRKGAGLFISNTSNEDNPLMQGVVPDTECGRPILCLDLWEHAYYGKYQNRRAEYIAAWWNVVNWTRVEQSFTVVTTTNA
jgi:Fe-Mn family superoxide dismutase